MNFNVKGFYILFLFIFPLIITKAQAQEHQSLNEHDKTEIIYEAIAVGIYAYAFEEEEALPGTELHFTLWWNHQWGAGTSYTLKYAEDETLQDLALLLSYNPTSWLTVNTGPNMAFPGNHRDFELLAYLEAEFNVRPKEWFHFGPVVGSLIGENSEVTVGFHVGFEF